MEIATCVTTCPREVNYLSDTLASIQESGFSDVCVYGDPERKGAYRNFLAAVQSESVHELPILAFQDDVQVSEGAREYLNAIPPEVWNERTAVVSIYSAEASQIAGHDWHQLPNVPACNFFGALAILLPVWSWKKLLANPPCPEALNQTDVRLWQVARREKMNIWLHTPSLVRHTGEVSSIAEWSAAHAKYRQCGRFLERV